MSCISCNNLNTTCVQCKEYLPCSNGYYPNPKIEYFSMLFHNLEYKYPINRSKCNNYGVNPKYYTMLHIPCDCKHKCSPC